MQKRMLTGAVGGCVLAASSMLAQPAMADDMYVARISGTVTQISDGSDKNFASFGFPAPFDPISIGTPYEVCVVYDTTIAGEFILDSDGYRQWENGVRIVGTVNGSPIGALFQVSNQTRGATAINSVPEDSVGFGVLSISLTRKFDARITLTDSTGSLFPGIGSAVIPEFLSDSWTGSDFDGHTFEFAYGKISDESKATLSGTGTVIEFGPLIDCNSNEIPDSCDIASGTSNDCNSNGIPDECEPDCNNSGVPDDCDIANGNSFDCNNNGIPDECETDCNNNGTPDDCDIAAGDAFDCNNNGVPDSCDVQNPAMDTNNDGYVDSCTACAGDTNNDGFVNGADLVNVFFNMGSSGPLGDVNYDGTVNFFDYYIVVWNYGSVCD